MNRPHVEWNPRSPSWTCSPRPTTSSRSSGSFPCSRPEMRPPARIARFLPLLCLAAALAPAGCATAPVRGKAVPDELQSVANVIGFPAGIRYFPRDAGHVVEFESDFLDSNERER